MMQLSTSSKQEDIQETLCRQYKWSWFSVFFQRIRGCAIMRYTNLLLTLTFWVSHITWAFIKTNSDSGHRWSQILCLCRSHSTQIHWCYADTDMCRNRKFDSRQKSYRSSYWGRL